MEKKVGDVRFGLTYILWIEEQLTELQLSCFLQLTTTSDTSMDPVMWLVLTAAAHQGSQGPVMDYWW